MLTALILAAYVHSQDTGALMPGGVCRVDVQDKTHDVDVGPWVSPKKAEDYFEWLAAQDRPDIVVSIECRDNAEDS